MNYILSDFEKHTKFLPLSYTRAIAEFRVGILTIQQKWEALLLAKVSIKTETYLQKKYELIIDADNTIINSAIIPDRELTEAISCLDNAVLISKNTIIAYNTNSKDISKLPNKTIEYNKEFLQINSVTDIFTLNGDCIIRDFDLITKDKISQKLSPSNFVFGKHPVFIEDSCFVEACTINTNDGPVYIGKNSKIMEGSNIRGPFAICENSEVKMGAKIYGPTTIGPGCKVGGEINNSVFFANSNKAHDGFLGNSVIGEWCNLGADTNNSNLKNNYAIVKLWSYETGHFVNTGLQFCGLIMGDHSKCGINTMFNTGTVVGVSANIFGAGFPRNFIPSFAWGGNAGMTEYKINNALDTINRVLNRRGQSLSEIEVDILTHIFNITAKYRMF